MVHGVTKSRTRLHDFTFSFPAFLGPSGGAISISTICLTHMVPLCLGSSEGISGKNFSEEPLTSESKQGTQDVWAPIQSGFCICEAPALLPPCIALPTPAAEAGSQERLCRTLNSGPPPPPPP